MDVLFLLVPLSVLVVFALLGVFAWALQAEQFDDLQHEGERILVDDAGLDADQGGPSPSPRHSRGPREPDKEDRRWKSHSP
jgi:cbb3-type cytochrome oxidase maturation protein